MLTVFCFLNSAKSRRLTGSKSLHHSIIEDLLKSLVQRYLPIWNKRHQNVMLLGKLVVVSIWPGPPVTKEVGIQVNMFLAASSP